MRWISVSPWLLSIVVAGCSGDTGPGLSIDVDGKADCFGCEGGSEVGQPWGSVEGILQFRGNPTHTFYGAPPVPSDPRVLWRFPDEPLCGESSVGGETREWCGSGWTGQPVIWERPDGVVEVIVGAYDHAVHFINADTGERTRPDFVTEDIIKGSVTLDPDGFPLLYFGSRDNRLRIVALDREVPTELWALNANVVSGMWNNDWDGNPSIVDDILFEGGENSYFFAVELHRRYGDDGLVEVSPEILLSMQGWTQELLDIVGDRIASIENSVVVFESRVYFANGHGRVVGLDVSRIREGVAEVVFDFWAGDDIDASIVVDEEGMLYVSVELERHLPRALELGQLLKLDPYSPDDPVLWSVEVPPVGDDPNGGIWATPALGTGVLYVATHTGRLMAVDRETGEINWEDNVGWHAWSSPLVVDGNLIAATCTGELRAYTLGNPRQPQPRWSLRVDSGGCIESTPALWRGRIVVGCRDGYIYAFGD